MTPAAELAREYFGAVGAGDRGRLLAVLADDVVYHFPGSSPFAGRYEGRDEVLGYLDRLRAVTGGSMQVEVIDVLLGEAVSAGFVRATARRGDRSHMWRLVALLRTGEEGIQEIRLFYDDQYGVDDFLSGDD
jgi:hypothetical protein